METDQRNESGFTLIELLVVIAIVVLVASLMLPVLSNAKGRARRTQCIGNLKQISMGVLMYADDHHQKLPGRAGTASDVRGWHAYKSLIRSYVGLNGPSPSRDPLFVCPADTFRYDINDKRLSEGHHEQASTDFSSYAFNNGNLISKRAGWIYPDQLLGVGQEPDTIVREPSRTILVADAAAWPCFSWHQPGKSQAGNYRFNNAWNVTGFVDGHVKYTSFYYDVTKAKGGESWHYDPPVGYEYRWSAR